MKGTKIPIFETATKGILAQDLSIESDILPLRYHAYVCLQTTHAHTCTNAIFSMVGRNKLILFFLTFAFIVKGLL